MMNEKKNYTDFTTDWEKMYDFWNMTKKEFLNSYSYLSEEEYNLTCEITLGCHICEHEVPHRVTEEDFVEAIGVQLNNFRRIYSNKDSEIIYDCAYNIAKHEAIAEFLMENLEVTPYIPYLVPYLDNLLNDFCDYEDNCNIAIWINWDELLKLLEQYLADKKSRKIQY